MYKIISDHVHCTPMEFIIEHPFINLGIVLVAVILCCIDLYYKKKDLEDFRNKHKKWEEENDL